MFRAVTYTWAQKRAWVEVSRISHLCQYNPCFCCGEVRRRLRDCNIPVDPKGLVEEEESNRAVLPGAYFAYPAVLRENTRAALPVLALIELS